MWLDLVILNVPVDGFQNILSERARKLSHVWCFRRSPTIQCFDFDHVHNIRRSQHVHNIRRCERVCDTRRLVRVCNIRTPNRPNNTANAAAMASHRQSGVGAAVHEQRTIPHVRFAVHRGRRCGRKRVLELQIHI
jgi:hypothetical protein